MKSGKRRITERIELPNKEKNQNDRRKGNLQILGNNGSGQHQTRRDKRKKTKKKTSLENEKTKQLNRNLMKGVNTWAVLLVRFSGPFLKWTNLKWKNLSKQTRKQENIWPCIRPYIPQLILTVQKRKKKRACQHWGCIDTTTRRLHRKALSKTDYSQQKQFWQHQDQQKENNSKTKMERKMTIWAF